MLTLADAQRALTATLAAADERGTKPLGVAVLDAGGNLVLFARQDGASLFRFDIARAKAKGALGMGVDTRILAERAAANSAFLLSIAAVTGDIALSPGGVLVRAADGAVRGAIGVSGDLPDLDEAAALAGAAAMSEGLDRCNI